MKIPFLIRNSDNSTIFNPKEIANTFAEYYSSLYNLKEDPNTPQPSDDAIQTFLADLSLPSLSQSQLESLNSPITEPEIQKAIKTLPGGKSSGPDGLPNSYYKTFHEALSPALKEVYSEAMSSALFTTEMLKAYVVTIPKPGKDPNTPANFRPLY